MASRTQVIVEGKTDKRILEAAFDMLFPGEEAFCEFVGAGGAANVASFIKTVSRMNKPASVSTIGLVDNDGEGRKQERMFGSHRVHPGGQMRSVNRTQRASFGMLPIPDMFADIHTLMKSLGGGESGLPLSIEYMFPPEVIRRAIDASVLHLKDRYATTRSGELALKINLTANYLGSLPSGFEHFAMEIDEASKPSFADWVTKTGRDAFVNFEEVFRLLRTVAAADNG